MERVSHFLDVQLGGGEKLLIKEMRLQEKEEILMYAAAMIYAKNEEFPYEIHLSDEMVKTDFADISNMTVTRTSPHGQPQSQGTGQKGYTYE